MDRGIEPLCQDWESCILTVRWIHHIEYFVTLHNVCGSWGIRTPGTINSHGSLANCWFQPLTQTSFPVYCTEAFSLKCGCKSKHLFLFLQMFLAKFYPILYILYYWGLFTLISVVFFGEKRTFAQSSCQWLRALMGLNNIYIDGACRLFFFYYTVNRQNRNSRAVKGHKMSWWWSSLWLFMACRFVKRALLPCYRIPFASHFAALRNVKYGLLWHKFTCFVVLIVFSLNLFVV